MKRVILEKKLKLLKGNEKRKKRNEKKLLKRNEKVIVVSVVKWDTIFWVGPNVV